MKNLKSAVGILTLSLMMTTQVWAGPKGDAMVAFLASLGDATYTGNGVREGIPSGPSDVRLQVIQKTQYGNPAATLRLYRTVTDSNNQTQSIDDELTLSVSGDTLTIGRDGRADVQADVADADATATSLRFHYIDFGYGQNQPNGDVTISLTNTNGTIDGEIDAVGRVLVVDPDNGQQIVVEPATETFEVQ